MVRGLATATALPVTAMSVVNGPLREVVVFAPSEPTSTALAAGLTGLGLSVRSVAFADARLVARVLETRPDLVIVQTGLPAADLVALEALGTVIEGLRVLSVPILAAVSRHHPAGSDLIAAVDDVLLPPHDPTEAIFRAGILLRRRGAAARLVSVGPLTVDVEGFRAWLLGEPLNLTYTEFQLLRMLLLNRGKVLTRQVLLNKIWGYDYLGGLRTVDVHIRRLRAKIEAEAPDLIETVRHVGYRIGE